MVLFVSILVCVAWLRRFPLAVCCGCYLVSPFGVLLVCCGLFVGFFVVFGFVALVRFGFGFFGI